MPFGAEAEGDRTRFRLWAPAAGRVELLLGDDAATPMQAEEGGWHVLTAPAPAGTRYRFRIDGELVVPDPASRWNPDDVHGASVVCDPMRYDWNDDGWRGRPWSDVVLYELHTGTFTKEGSFDGVRRRLEHLRGLGVTALELMPVADFRGARNWGYDGVLLFAPDASYGSPDDLKKLIDTAHGLGLMVFLDVVYNHFGPEGNYLNAYAPGFFDPEIHTPWGSAIDFSNRTVRDFYLHNALYWIEEFHIDGLRFDAVHAIVDRTRPDILEEIAAAVRRGPGEQRHVHLVLENDRNESWRLRGRAPDASACDAQWNDDVHHAFHVLLTGERDGYYRDYAGAPLSMLGRCLAEGFAYQGEASIHRGGEPRGEPSGDLPPTAFVAFLQNHDQIGNRAFGERIGMLAPEPRLKAAVACLLLAPEIPLLFMGEEFASSSPFQFFCDFSPELARAVSEGRRREFEGFEHFGDAGDAEIPEPSALSTFERSVLDWDAIDQPEHAAWLAFYRRLLGLRAAEIMPRLAAGAIGAGSSSPIGDRGLSVQWQLADAEVLSLWTNLSDEAVEVIPPPAGRLLFAWPEAANAALEAGRLAANAAVWRLHREAAA